MANTKKTDAATPAKTVSETGSTPPAKVGAVVASTTKITKNMSIPEMMDVMAPAAAEYNEAIGAIIHNETTARRLEKDVLYPGLLRYREWIKSTPVAERKQVTEHYTLVKYTKFLGLGESLLRLWDFREKNKQRLGSEVLRLQQEGQGNGNKQSDAAAAAKKKQEEEAAAKKAKEEQERLEREQATAKLLRDKAALEQNLKNANVDLSVATNYANDNPADADPAELEAAQAKYTAAHGAVEDAAEAIAVAEAAQTTPTHEAFTDSNTDDSNTDKVQEPVESEVLNPVDHSTLSPETQAVKGKVQETKNDDLAKTEKKILISAASVLWYVHDGVKRGCYLFATGKDAAATAARSIGIEPYSATKVSDMDLTFPVILDFDLDSSLAPTKVYFGSRPASTAAVVLPDALKVAGKAAGSVFTGGLVTDRIGVESVGQDKSEAA